MNSDLFAITFPGERDAWRVESALRLIGERQPLGLSYSAALSRDGTGKTEVRLLLNLPINLQDPKLWLLCQFVNAFSNSDAEMSEVLVEAGLDRLFLEQLTEALAPAASALIIYAPSEMLTDIQRLETVLSLFKARLFRATLPEKFAERVLAHAAGEEN